jgi:hypothetical protein
MGKAIPEKSQVLFKGVQGEMEAVRACPMIRQALNLSVKPPRFGVAAL